jgi:surfactin synthase thioesterase subunit/glycosyltransferase involved in cell wall biosynthesis
MRILLAHNSTYYPSHGGGDLSNRLLIEALAAKGHECLVVARAEGRRELLTDLAQRDVAATVEEPGIVRFTLNGVEVHVATEAPNLRAYFARSLASFEPDSILASTDDSAQILLETALASGRSVVYMARATIALPFGPDSAFPSQEKTQTLRRVHGMVGVSRYVAEYIRRYSGIEAVALPISFMGGGPFPDVGRFENEFITMVNPCVVKGIDLFVALADALPDLKFAAVPTWGTCAEDFAKLRVRPNITILAAEDRIERILARTRVLLSPSLWAEARSRIVVEAMLHGVPVIASDTGGLPEAKLGVPYVLPVNPITGYRPSLDERMVPRAEAPPQDLVPWVETVRRLCTNRTHWAEIAGASRAAALRYVDRELQIEPIEALLKEAKPPAAMAASDLSAKKRLLALRLRTPWLTPLEFDNSKPNILYFPYAGSRAPFPGTTLVRYPATLESMDQVMAELIRHVAPLLPRVLKFGFVLFGHSMGAGIAFEFTRALRRLGLPMPFALLVSAATAPQLRTTIAPDPPNDHPDSAFYRRYLYKSEPKLDIPIRAYGGADDHSVQLDPWREQTLGSFCKTLFPGGHLYLTEQSEALLAQIRKDIDELRPR